MPPHPSHRPLFNNETNNSQLFRLLPVGFPPPAPQTPPSSPQRKRRRRDTLTSAVRENLLGPTACDLSDVTLISSDDERIPACRALLAVRSHFFRNLFFHAFAERGSPEVSVPTICAASLRSLIQFAYTDEADIIDRADGFTKKREASALRPLIPLLVDLALVADFVDIPALAERTCNLLTLIIDTVEPSVACHVFERIGGTNTVNEDLSALSKHAARAISCKPTDCLQVPDIRLNMNSKKTSLNDGRKHNKRTMDSVQQIIPANDEQESSLPNDCAPPPPSPNINLQVINQSTTGNNSTNQRSGGVLALSERSLDILLSDKDILASDNYLFQVVYFWATNGKTLLENSDRKKKKNTMMFGVPIPTPNAPLPIASNNPACNSNSRSCSASENPQEPNVTSFQVHSSLADVHTHANLNESNQLHHSQITETGEIENEEDDDERTVEESEIQPGTTGNRAVRNRRISSTSSIVPIRSPNKSNDDAVTQNAVPKLSHSYPMAPFDMGATGEDQDPNRWHAAQRLAQRIEFEKIKPSFLCKFVATSGLVSMRDLYKAYEAQALEAERGRTLYDNIRGGSLWANGTKVLRATCSGFKNFMLLCPRITSGRHEWTFHIVRKSACLWIGFTGAECVDGGKMFAMRRDGWAYSADGDTIPHSVGQVKPYPVLQEGKQVRVILNLVRSGTVTLISLGERRSCTPFKELKGKVPWFRLCVCMSDPGHIELIDEKHRIA